MALIQREKSTACGVGGARLPHKGSGPGFYVYCNSGKTKLILTDFCNSVAVFSLVPVRMTSSILANQIKGHLYFKLVCFSRMLPDLEQEECSLLSRFGENFLIRCCIVLPAGILFFFTFPKSLASILFVLSQSSYPALTGQDCPLSSPCLTCIYIYF